MTLRAKVLTACAAAALAVPAAALADPGHGHGGGPGHGHNPTVTYVFKGTFDGTDSVQVARGNSFVRKGGMVGTLVQFDLSNTRLTVADTNNDGVTDATDVLAGDQVVVKARLAKSNPGSQPFAARRLVDQTNQPAEDGQPED